MEKCYDMIPKTVEVEMRGFNHPDPEMDVVEHQIAEIAYRNITSVPDWADLPPKVAYNFVHLNTFYGTQNPQILNLVKRLDPYPMYLEGEVTSKCNLKCVMCERQYWDEKPSPDWTVKDFLYVLDQFPELKWAAFNPIAEQFMNKDFFRMMEIMEERQICQELYNTTYLLSTDQIEKLVKMKSLMFMKFSHDAATPETYESIRVNAKWDKVVRNIKAFDEFKKVYGRSFPKIEFHYIVMKQNIHEVEQFIDWVDSLDIECNGIMFSQLLHKFPEVEDMYVQIPQQLGERLVEKGKRVGIPVYFNSDAQSCKPPVRNCTQFLMPFVFVSGEVNSCCAQNEANCRALQKEWTLGNIFETPMREIWNSKWAKDFRHGLWNNKILSPICEMCATHDTSKAIREVKK